FRTSACADGSRAQAARGSQSHDGLDLPAPYVRRDCLVKLDGKRQSAKVLTDATNDGQKRIRAELTPANDLQHDSAVLALHRLELPYQLSPCIAQEDVKHDAWEGIPIAVDNRIGAPAVHARYLRQPASTCAPRRLSGPRYIAVDVADQRHSIVVKIGHHDVAR